MNVKTGKILVSGAAIALAGSVAALAAVQVKSPEIREVPVPGPTVTEHRAHGYPIPGPTVTKKVTVTKTVRPEYPKKVTRSNERKWKAPKTQAPQVTSGSARSIARQIFGSQFSCADALITKESGWNVYATNPSSGAYGLPQALPGSRMASHGSDWRTNPRTQLLWMRDYVASRYGGVCGAWSHSQKHNWY